MSRFILLTIVSVIVMVALTSRLFVTVDETDTGTIYIRSDGSVDPIKTDITRNGDIYTLTLDTRNPIVVEKDNVVIDGSGHAMQGMGEGVGVSLSGRKNVTIKGIQISAFQTGIYVSQSSECLVLASGIESNNHYGLLLVSSSNNSIVANNVTANGWHGIHLLWCSNNRISGNSITSNHWIGTWLYGSSNNTIVGNAYTSDGVFVEESYSNIVDGNVVNGKPIAYLENVVNRTLNHAGQVIMINCSGIRVENLNLSDTAVGVSLWRTSNCTLAANNIAANHFFGIRLYESSNNSIYHNNFIDNPTTHQSYAYASSNDWDDGYPSGGNYWSNYVGSDRNGDNVGDEPYVINSENSDRYPLMKPYAITESL